MFNNLKLREKISIIMILIMFLIMATVSYINYTYTTKIIKQEVNSKLRTLNKFYKSTIDDIIYNLDREITRLSNNNILESYVELVNKRYRKTINIKTRIKQSDKINKILEAELEEENRKLDTLLLNSDLNHYVGMRIEEYIKNIEFVKFAYITLPDGFVIVDSRRKRSINNFNDLYLKKQLVSTDYRKVDFSSINVIDGKPYLLFNTEIKDEFNNIIGYLVLVLPPGILEKNIDTSLGDYSSIVTLINKKGEIINHPDKDEIGNIIRNQWILENIQKDNYPADITEGNQYYIIDKIKGKNLYLTAQMSRGELLAPATRIGKIDLYIFLVGIVVTIIIIYLTMFWQLKPLNILLNKMQKVRKGNLDVQLQTNNKDEIGTLASTFNKMINDLKKLMNKVKDDQEEIRKLELSALQLQINPHFLYNTLDSISLMTRTKEYEEIAEMCISLSQFFRLGLNDGKDIYTIKDEIEHVKNYIVIQKLRYPDKFKCEIDVDEEIYDNQCIKIILQPLVENALKHGLKFLSSGGLITIKGFKENNRIVLKVIDNGCGFDKEDIETLLNTTPDSRKGYAVKNVNRRIKLYYGEKYGLRLSNTEVGGACVELYLPVKKGEDKDV